MAASADETNLLIQAVVFVLCVLASAFFSGAETALTSMTKIRVKRLFGEGEEVYKKLEPWLHNPNHFLATILVGNNFVNILASVLAANICETILLTWFSASIAFAYGSAVAVAIATFLLLVFGEIVPKTYSKEHAVRISQKVIGPLSAMYRVLRPVIALFLFLSNSIIRLFGGPAIKELSTLTEDDIRALIEMSEKEGVLEEEEREMIHSIIDFGDLHVNEIMTPRVDFHAINVDLSWDRAKEEAVKHGHSRIPVYENDLDHIVGVLYVKDLLREGNGHSHIVLRDILRPSLIVPETKKVSELLTMFRKEKNHMAIVVDEYGLTTGLVTIEDALEEIVGDIQDEYDDELPEYEIGEDGAIVADAKINLYDLSELLEEEFPEEDVKTLGGFISSISGTVPEIGEEVRYKDFLFVILDSDERRIIRVKIVREAKDSPEANSRPEKERNDRHQADEPKNNS
ncbi:MAG: hemolysin family protein [Candidatus Omnitrophota bacterium]